MMGCANWEQKVGGWSSCMLGLSSLCAQKSSSMKLMFGVLLFLFAPPPNSSLLKQEVMVKAMYDAIAPKDVPQRTAHVRVKGYFEIASATVAHPAVISR